MTSIVCRPARRPARHHPADPPWLFAKTGGCAANCRERGLPGAALAAAGPLCRPSDYLLPASGQRCPSGTAHLGDRDGARERPALPRKRADPPRRRPPPAEVVFRLQSTSTLILLASLFAAGICTAGDRRHRVLEPFGRPPSPAAWRCGWRWPCAGVCCGHLSFLAQLSAGGRPARLPGVVFGHAALPFRDFMISSLSLFSYATALWLHSEILI